MDCPEHKDSEPQYTPRKAYIVSHTHWDREWYLTYHTFRVNFTRVVKLILAALEDDPEFKHFLLDGQTAILEDYLEVHPEDAPRIAELVADGKLSLGPWYILPDEFLINAEAHVRNLVYGHKVAGQYGGVQKVGYMPDSFGHIAQLPQLLHGAGIDSFIYTRGNGDELERSGFEYTWAAPDGSCVLAVNQCGGYDNAAGLGFAEIWHAHTRRELSFERAVQQVHDLFTKFGERSNGEIVLLNNGCDHFPPQQDFAEVLEVLRESFPATEFIHTDLSEYVGAVREAEIATETHTGELLGGKLHHILSGVWSARMPLKQLNDKAQSWLTDYLEPLSSYTHFRHHQPYPAGLIEYAWKLLLKNHPHDSICGCSIDEVHTEMLPRFAGVIETAEQECLRQLEELAPTFARRADADRDTVLCVFNPLPWRRDAVVRRLVVLQPLDYNFDALRLLNERGEEVPYRIAHKWYVERFWGVDYRTLFNTADQLGKLTGYLDAFEQRFLKSEADRDSADCFLLIEFVARDLPAVGHVNFHLTDRPDDLPERTELDSSPRVVMAGNTLRNEHVQVEVHPNGTFDLHCNATGRSYTGLNLLVDSADCGDEYDYSPVEHDTMLSSAQLGTVVEELRPGCGLGALVVRFNWQLPATANPQRTARSIELMSCPVEVRVSLAVDSPVVDLDVHFDNLARDHRLCAQFPAGIKTRTLTSHGHFLLNERPITPPAGEGWVQPHPGTYPQQDFSLVEDKGGGLAVLNRGLPEVAPLLDLAGGAGLSLTLLRAVGWLSRDDFESRKHSNAGPTIPTPDAQCLGPQRFRYAVMPYAGAWHAAHVLRHNAEWRTPPLVLQGVEDQSVSGGTGLLEVIGPVEVTAIKRHEARDTLIVRLYNPLSEPVKATVQTEMRVNNAWHTNLLEERASDCDLVDEHSIIVELMPHQIMSLELDLG